MVQPAAASGRAAARGGGWRAACWPAALGAQGPSCCPPARAALSLETGCCGSGADCARTGQAVQLGVSLSVRGSAGSGPGLRGAARLPPRDTACFTRTHAQPALQVPELIVSGVVARRTAPVIAFRSTHPSTQVSARGAWRWAQQPFVPTESCVRGICWHAGARRHGFPGKRGTRASLLLAGAASMFPQHRHVNAMRFLA